MPGFGEVLTASLGVFGVIALGALLRRLGMVPASADPVLNRMVINVFFPALIFSNLHASEALADRANLFQAPILGALTIGMGYLICRLAAPLFGLRPGPEAGTFALTAGMYNYGFIALPLIMALFPSSTTGVLFLHNVGVDVMLWTAGLFLVNGQFGWRSLRRAANLPLLAIVLALVLSPFPMPAFLMFGVKMVGHCAIPMALMLIGASIMDQVDRDLLTTRLAIPLGAIVLRLGLLPLLMIGLAIWLPLSLDVKRVVLVQAAMPCAVFPIVLARQYGGDVATGTRCVLATALVSAVSLPLWIRFGLGLLEG